MEDRSSKKFWIVLALTAIPITDFVGANWFYARHTLVGLIKIALCIALVVLLYVANILNQFGASLGVMGVIIIGVIWWLVDVFLVALRKRL